VIGVVVDITDRKRSERSLERVNRLLRTMTGVNEALIHSSSGSELMQRMCDVIVSVGHYDGASIALWSAGQLELASMAGAYPTRAAHAEAMGQSPISGAPRVSGTCAFFPLLRQSAAIGSLGIRTGYQESFDGDEMALLTDMAGDLSYGISVLLDRTEHEAFSERLRRSMEDTIAALAAMAEMRDAYTAGHQRHVAELAAAIAREMGLDESRVRAIHLAAVVHDIGKIKIPAELLTKPVRLTPIETQLMRTHVEAGYDILKGIDFPWPIADIVRQHHERIDGSGYPHGLTGDQLHLEAKILAVADVVDATAAHRPYRFGKGIESALADLQAASGILYDSASVDACVAVFQKGFTFSPPRAPEPDPL
jgi:putative nucleotidyltransferase with HDIG domain